MPSSDEMFGTPTGEAKPLAPAMFNFGPPGGPTPEELVSDYERALHTKSVRLKAVSIKTYDLSKPKDVEEYSQLVIKLFNEAKSGQIVVQQHERKFIEQPSPHWIVHIEWWEYTLMVDGKELTPEEYEQWRKLERDKAAQEGAEDDDGN